MQTLLRSPLAHFLIGGTLLYALVHGPLVVRQAEGAAPAPVVLDAGAVEQLLRDHARDNGVEPSADDEAALVERAIDEELLHREALARGLDRDRSVRNWLVEQMRALTPDEDIGADRLYERALALGLDRTDLVVRRLLIQKMRLLAARQHERPPSDDELAAYHAIHAADYAIAERVTFWQVFFSNANPRPAQDLLVELRRTRREPADAARHGEPFTAPPHLRAQSAADLRRRFGDEFATQIAALPAGEWSGPIASSYGWHLVWVEERAASQAPALESVRGQLSERWLAEQRQRRLDDTLRSLRQRYPLRIESAAWQQRSR